MSTIQNIEEADDLTQEVFIQVFKSIDNFKGNQVYLHGFTELHYQNVMNT